MHRVHIRAGKRIRPTANRGKLSGWGKGAYPGNLQALDFGCGIDRLCSHDDLRLACLR